MRISESNGETKVIAEKVQVEDVFDTYPSYRVVVTAKRENRYAEGLRYLHIGWYIKGEERMVRLWYINGRESVSLNKVLKTALKSYTFKSDVTFTDVLSELKRYFEECGFSGIEPKWYTLRIPSPEQIRKMAIQCE